MLFCFLGIYGLGSFLLLSIFDCPDRPARHCISSPRTASNSLILSFLISCRFWISNPLTLILNFYRLDIFSSKVQFTLKIRLSSTSETFHWFSLNDPVISSCCRRYRIILVHLGEQSDWLRTFIFSLSALLRVIETFIHPNYHFSIPIEHYWVLELHTSVK